MQKRQQRRRHSHEWDAGTLRSGNVITGKQVAKIGYLLQKNGSYSLAHDAVLDFGQLGT